MIAITPIELLVIRIIRSPPHVLGLLRAKSGTVRVFSMVQSREATLEEIFVPRVGREPSAAEAA